MADQVDWRFLGAKRLPYTGAFKTTAEIGRWFASIVFTVRGGKIVRFWGIYDTEASAGART